MSEFKEFPKIPRLFRAVIVTEKIDGTNASVEIIPAGTPTVGIDESHVLARNEAGDIMLAGSRTRYVVPVNDNYGWAAWVKANAAELWALGPGQHFGEWWGQGIQRKYGLAERRFSLFNVGRWYDAHGTNAPDDIEKQRCAPACCRVVPILERLPKMDTAALEMCLAALRVGGSKAAAGFMNPEGIVAFHTASGQLFKATCEKDAEPKGRTA